MPVARWGTFDDNVAVTIPDDEERHVPVHVSRTRDGRVLGGVCAGLPAIWGLGTNALRTVFVLAAFCGGIGIVLYLACWLVIPVGESDSDASANRGIVVVAWAAGALVGLVLIAAFSAAAAVFGLGWLAFGIACAALGVGLIGRTRIPSVAVLLTVAALALPAAAVALSPVRIALQSGRAVSRPARGSDLRHTVFRSGFGTLLVDLRHTQLPRSGSLPMHIDAGLRRTIVALPANRCVRVRVHYAVHTFVGQFATLLSGHQSAPFGDVVLFGDIYGGTQAKDPHGVVRSRADRDGLTLDIDFSSLGGGLFVRDYPDSVSPDRVPNWPGFVVTSNTHSYRRGELSKKQTSEYRRRLQVELRDRRFVNTRVAGPCVP